jgi:hypothetical protein
MQEGGLTKPNLRNSLSSLCVEGTVCLCKLTRERGGAKQETNKKGWTSANIIPVQCTVCKKGLQIRQKLLTRIARNPEQCTYYRAIYSLFRCLKEFTIDKKRWLEVVAFDRLFPLRFQTNRYKPHPLRGLKQLSEPCFCHLQSIVVCK